LAAPSLAAGAAVMAKAITPATSAAAAIPMIGLNILSPCASHHAHLMGARTDNAWMSWTFHRRKVNREFQREKLLFERSNSGNEYRQSPMEL
jgi:hypothetical protein